MCGVVSVVEVSGVLGSLLTPRIVLSLEKKKKLKLLQSVRCAQPLKFDRAAGIWGGPAMK